MNFAKITQNFIQNNAVKFAARAMRKSLYNDLKIELVSDFLAPAPDPQKKYMLYAHIPFCHTFCPYCSFHKYAYDEAAALEYFKNLCTQLTQIKAAGYDFNALYVGGGTTLINEKELIKTLELAKKLFNISEISCETDPNHIDKLPLFRGLIDRLSIGVQSFDDDILRKVARLEKFGNSEVLKEKLAHAIGILPATSIDLIFNFPFQTREMLLNDINAAKALNPEQITFYPLMKSNLTKEKIAASLGVSAVDNEREFYEIICREFSGYERNNAWSFSRKKMVLKDEYVGAHHEYLGAGSGAFSFLGGELFINAFNLSQYGEKIAQNQSPIIAKCGFSRRERIKYLFLTEIFDGEIDISKFDAKNGVKLRQMLSWELWLLRICGAIEISGERVILSDFGRYICVVLMKEFYIGMDIVRAIFRDDERIKNSKKLRIKSV